VLGIVNSFLVNDSDQDVAMMVLVVG